MRHPLYFEQEFIREDFQPGDLRLVDSRRIEDVYYLIATQGLMYDLLDCLLNLKVGTPGSGL